MDSFHNPDRFVADLRQILSQGRKRIGLLVGAGAPLAIKIGSNPLIPGVDELTQMVIDALTEQQKQAVLGIKADIGSTANIESILSRIRLLQQVLGTTRVSGLDGAAYGNLAKAICTKIGELVAVKLPPGPGPYTELVSWICGTSRAHGVEIFTTNYDLLFEEAFERARAPYFDGFSGGSAPFFDPVTVASDDLPPRWSRLWKLHGSIGWAQETDVVVRGKGREATQLVYPDHLKYDLTQKQPYSALFERLRNFLLTPDTLLLIIGFSFRDSHICAVLDESLSMNANCAALAFQYRSLDDESPACTLAIDRPNLSVYARDGAIIGGVRGSWRLGNLPKNWIDIRASFWGLAAPAMDGFLLGDFASFSRFCALAKATELRPNQESPVETNDEAAFAEKPAQ